MSFTTGALAPDFTLKSQHGEDITLSSFRGHKSVVLVFFPFAFSGVCSGELAELRDHLDQFEALDAEVVAVSCDPFFANRVFSDRDGLQFPILSDFWPHGEVAQAYGVFNAEIGAPNRGTFVIDRDGRIVWHVVNNLSESRDFRPYLAAISGVG